MHDEAHEGASHEQPSELVKDLWAHGATGRVHSTMDTPLVAAHHGTTRCKGAEGGAEGGAKGATKIG